MEYKELTYETINKLFKKYNKLSRVSKDMFTFMNIIKLATVIHDGDMEEAMKVIENDIDIYIKEETK